MPIFLLLLDLIIFFLFEQVNEFIRDKTLDISYTNFITFSGSLQNKLNRYAECFISDKPLNDFLFKWERGFSIPIHCALFKKDIWFDNLPFNTKLKSKEDWFMWVELMIKNAKISLLNKEYAFYRIHDKSMSRDEMSNINSLIHLSILISLNLNDQLREEYIKEKLKHILNTIKYNISIEKNIIKNSIRYRLGNFLIYPIYKIYKLIK